MSNEFNNSENQNNPYSNLYNNYGKEETAKADSNEAAADTEHSQNINNSSMNAGTTGSNNAASGNYYRSEDHSYASQDSGSNAQESSAYTSVHNSTYAGADNSTYAGTDNGNAYTANSSDSYSRESQNAASGAYKQAAEQGVNSEDKKGFFNKKTSGGNGSGKTKTSGGMFKKAVALAMSAVLFGGIAGGTMLGVQAIGKKTGIVATETTGTQIKVAESTKSTTTASGSSSSTSGLGDVSDVVSNVLPSIVSITNSQVYENYSSQYGDDWSNFFNYFYGGGSDSYGSYGSGNSNGNSNSGNSSNGSSSSDSDSNEVATGAGSGIIIGQNDSEILIVTNYHVIEDADSLTITFVDDTTAKASVKGTDEDNDLAVVAVKTSDLEKGTSDNIAIATLDTKDDCKVGQGVIAIGNALGYGQSITVGYISALNRSVTTSDGTTKDLLQTDAAINPGNSGGALINTDGEIIGINSAKYSDTDVEGMGFAIPISKVYSIIDDLMNQETKVEVAESERGYLGINASTVDSNTQKAYNMPAGVYVYSILEGGAASKSELQAYDIITKLDGTSVTSKEDLIEDLKYYKIGDTVTLTVSRNTGNGYEEMKIKVTLDAQVNN